MKKASTILIVAVAIFCMGRIGSADRLYLWVDSEGVSHISKEPPSQRVNSVDVMEYSVRKGTPDETVQVPSGKAPQKQKNQKNSVKLHKAEKQPSPNIDMNKACYIQAGKQDVYVYVTEDRRPGGSSYQNVLWIGDISRGQKILIRSSRGKIKFSYQRTSDSRASSRYQAECINGKVIRIR